MGMCNHLVRGVFLLREELAESDDGGEEEGDLGDEDGLEDEKGETLEGDGTHHADLHGGGREQGAHVLVLTAAWNQERDRDVTREHYAPVREKNLTHSLDFKNIT